MTATSPQLNVPPRTPSQVTIEKLREIAARYRRGADKADADGTARGGAIAAQSRSDATRLEWAADFLERWQHAEERWRAFDEMREALANIVQHGMVAAPGPHFRWPDEYYEVFDKARAALAKAAEVSDG